MEKKKVTKKEIACILRSGNITKIFQLYYRIHGNIDRHGLYHFIRSNAPSKRVYRDAYHICHNKPKCAYSHLYKGKHGYFDPLPRQKVVEKLLEECNREIDNYSKRPFMGNTHLYFCSPIYGHSDYNKWMAIDIKGNERFCEVIKKYADKHFGK